MLTWGKCNVYYYSYYKHHDQNLSITYNTLPIALMALPIALLTMVSLPIAKRVGHALLIRTVAAIQFMCLLLASQMTTYLSFILFFLVGNAMCYAISIYPLLACIWSHFPKNEGQVMGFVLGVFSFATLFYVFLITYLCNPQN